MLKQRVITGLILILLVVAGIRFLPDELFGLFALVFIVGLGAWEWAGLTGCYRPEKRMMGALMILLATLPLIFFQLPVVSLLWISIPIWLAILVGLFWYPRNAGFYKRHALPMRILGIFVLIPAWYALFKLHGIQDLPRPGYWYVFYLIALTSLADTAAYFTGRKFGKHKLAPHLSPGKTLEGLAGAIVVTSLWAVSSAWWLGLPTDKWLVFVVLSMLVVLMSVAGDLFESLLKREAGVKDSGTFLPGHGGVLDRIDSMLSAAPIFTLGLIWLMRATS